MREDTLDWNFGGDGSVPNAGSKEGKRDQWRLRKIFGRLGF